MKKIFPSKLKKLKRKKPRRGWAKAFKRMAKNGDDKLLMPDVFEDEKFELFKI
jgi:antitoxin MazE